MAESIEFSGKVIVQMAQDPKIHKYTSKVVIGAEVNLDQISNQKMSQTYNYQVC